MKKVLFLIFFTCCIHGFSQVKEDIIFYFNEKNTDTYVKNDSIYIVDGLSFKFNSQKHTKEKMEYETIKEKIISIEEFKQKTKGKKFPEFYNQYNFYLFIRENNKYGCLLEVEKVWLVEDKIVN